MPNVFKWILKNLEYSVIVIPLIVGAFQIYFSKSDNLSAWRGGGFGMYTEPHPVKSRVAFLINQSESSNNWIQVYPIDPRLEGDSSINKDYLKHLRAISGIAANRISFPSRVDLERIKQELISIHDGSNLQNDVFTPTDTIMLQVLEIGISSDYLSVVQRKIYDVKLCVKK